MIAELARKMILTFFHGSKPSASYLKRDFCTAYLHQKVPKNPELFGHKKSSRTAKKIVREQLFVEITGKYRILAP